MNGFEYITQKQKAWAKRHSIELMGSAITRGNPLYTKSLSQNFFEKLDKEVKHQIGEGDGGELTSTKTKAAKMSALHSSSALGVNLFQYWKKNNINDIAYALGFCNKNSKVSKKIVFEKKFPIDNKFRYSPNIDVVIENKRKKERVFAIECKFSEAYASRKHTGLKEAYFGKIEDIWKDIPELKKFSRNISPGDSNFKHLHPAQLVKHILGLKKQLGGKENFGLMYLWYDVLGPEGVMHQQEIDEFTKVTQADGIKFHSLSYQALILKLQKEFYSGHSKYLNYISDRYL